MTRPDGRMDTNHPQPDPHPVSPATPAGPSPPVLMDYARPPRSLHAAEILLRISVTSAAVWLALLLTCLVVDTRFAAAIIAAAAVAAVSNVVAVLVAPVEQWELRRAARAAMWFTLPPAALTLAAAIILPNLSRPREEAQRVKCAPNLRQIGAAIQLYANDHGGILPQSLDRLILGDYLTSEVFICPSSDDKRAEGPTTQAVATAVVTIPEHCSYVYLGGGHTYLTATPKHVLAYEHHRNHRGNGMNVLYGDGLVQWLDKPQADRVLAELKAGQNPPRE